MNAEGDRPAAKKQVLPHDRRVDSPSRVPEHQIHRPDQRAQVEPDDPTGEQNPLDDA